VKRGRSKLLNTELFDTESPAIKLEAVYLQYDNSNSDVGIYIPAWTVKRGERILLYGESGSGKTTILNLLSGILIPNQGSIEILRQPFSSLPSHRRDRFRAQHIGVVFQQFNLIPYLSVLKNIELACYFAKSNTRKTKAACVELLEQLKLSASILCRPANSLSVGQQQRVAIARALINNPEILLVDEPTSAPDTAAKESFMAILMKMCTLSGTTLVFVSHDMDLRYYFESSIEVSSLIQPVESENVSFVGVE